MKHWPDKSDIIGQQWIYF